MLISLSVANFVLDKIEKPIIKISKQESAINLNATIVDTFSLGYRRLATAIFWMSTILESDHEHYKAKDANSWMFLRFNLIATLDPSFYENYAFGGQYLSIIKDDDIGAKIILDKGLKRFPDDYNLNAIASFHYHFELNDTDNAKKLYKKLISFQQTPPHIVPIYSKIISSMGELEDAYQIMLLHYQKNINVPYLSQRYKDNLYAIKAEIDLTCLNSKKTGCEKFDFDKNPYILKNNQYQAIKPWNQFRLKREKNSHP